MERKGHGILQPEDVLSLRRMQVVCMPLQIAAMTFELMMMADGYSDGNVIMVMGAMVTVVVMIARPSGMP